MYRYEEAGPIFVVFFIIHVVVVTLNPDDVKVYVIILCIAISGYSIIFDSMSTLLGTFYESSSRKTKTDICQVQYDMWSEVGAQVLPKQCMYIDTKICTLSDFLEVACYQKLTMKNGNQGDEH